METITKDGPGLTVVVRETREYSFPLFPEAKCSAHGSNVCLSCARNPGDCVADTGSCSMYASTGMHWDSCRNRIR